MTRGAIWRFDQAGTKTHVRVFSRDIKLPKYVIPASVLVFLVALVLVVFLAETAAQRQAKQATTVWKADAQTYIDGEDTSSATISPTTPNEDSDVKQGTTVTTDTSIVNGQPATSVTVNGQQVPISQQGSTQQTVQTGDSETQLNITVNNSQTAGSANVQAFSSNNSWVSSSSNIVQFNSNGGR